MKEVGRGRSGCDSHQLSASILWGFLVTNSRQQCAGISMDWILRFQHFISLFISFQLISTCFPLIKFYFLLIFSPLIKFVLIYFWFFWQISVIYSFIYLIQIINFLLIFIWFFYFFFYSQCSMNFTWIPLNFLFFMCCFLNSLPTFKGILWNFFRNSIVSLNLCPPLWWIFHILGWFFEKF